MSYTLIHIFGSSGSGSTTLARAISQAYHYHFIDTDDAIWEETDPPFNIRKTDDEALNYLKSELNQYPKSVISGAFVGWGEEIKKQVDLFVYMHLPLDIRLERIKKREKNRFHDRVEPGGDLYLQHLDFLNWVSLYEELDESKRSQKQHHAWLQSVQQPVIEIYEEKSIEELLEILGPYLG
ncbi:MAG: AAA family ATPase [Candidatus Izemoplasmatales bacterium]